MELWVKIESHPQYLISSLGRVKHKRGTLLAFALNHKGYHRVFLYNKEGGKYYFVHRLVAKAFIPNTENSPQVNHKNAIKCDNNVDNLEWVTNRQNQDHAIRNGLKARLKGSKNGTAVLNEQKVLEIRAKLLPWTGFTIALLAREYGSSETRVRAIRDRTNWRHV